MDRLLKRQLRRFLGEDWASRPGFDGEEFAGFLDAVEKAYAFNRNELLMLERTLELNSEELNEANQKLKEQNDAISEMATRDALTGLANRLLCHERVEHALSYARRYDTQFSLLFIDLDRFKRINDTLGHHVGDALLIEVSNRLRKNVRDSDLVSRLGGDEFTVLLENIPDVERAQSIADKLLHCLSEPYFIEGRELRVTASIGAGLYPTDGDSVVDIFKNADTAMYHVKENGRNNVQVYNARMHDNAVQDLDLETALRKAIEQDELSVHYQPKVHVRHHRLSGMEALMRWHSKTLGPVPPDVFIPIAERAGLIVDLGGWILRHACLHNAAWQDAGLRPMRVAVNISGTQLGHRSFIEQIERALNESGLSPQYLELEITESTMMRADEIGTRNMNYLKQRGIRLAVDDFGTGYSSLSTIKQYPIDSLKVDKGFVRNLVTDADDAAIVTAIIAMSRSMNLKTIAEGVETVEQLRHLTALGCTAIQGYLISRPLPADQFCALLEKDPDYTELFEGQPAGAERVAEIAALK